MIVLILGRETEDRILPLLRLQPTTPTIQPNLPRLRRKRRIQRTHYYMIQHKDQVLEWLNQGKKRAWIAGKLQCPITTLGYYIRKWRM